MIPKTIFNAKITDVFLGIEDHGILTIYLTCAFDECSAGRFGGYALDSFNKAANERVGHKICADFILKILNVCDVVCWNDIQGSYIRVVILDGQIVKIGHIIKDIWFDPATMIIGD